MRKLGTWLVMVLLAGTASADSLVFWDFESMELPKDSKAKIETVVPYAELWDGQTVTLFQAENKNAIRFDAADVPGVAPAGSDMTLPGNLDAIRAATFTAEMFVRVDRPSNRFALLISKRRDGDGSSWGLSLTPQGQLSARFDTQTGESKIGFNYSLAAPFSLHDGEWHHVALTVNGQTLEVQLFVDYQLQRKATLPGPLVYDDSPLVLGRGLSGWLDAARLSSDILHPEQFLRPVRFFSDMAKKKPTIDMLDTSYTRVQSGLRPEMKRLGTLLPKNVSEMETARWSLGCECLDRNLADWDSYKKYLVPLGIKRIRLQGGWGRTEKQKGVYDFAWLDHIVDDALEMGLEVCLETSYGNHLYDPKAAMGPGGYLPSGEEELKAWDAWVAAMVKHYAPKGVHEWMMYNEPNLKREFNTPDRIVENNVRTASVIKSIDPDAKIAAFVLAGLNYDVITQMLTKIKEMGQLDLFTWAVYHGYSGNPDRINDNTRKLVAWLAENAPNVRAWQGESGCASEEVQYALAGIIWTEYSQAKWNARRMLSDIGCGSESSLFTISDLSYSKDFISRYGLLKTNADNSVFKVKSAFYTAQNVVTLFNDTMRVANDRTVEISETDEDVTVTAFLWQDKKTGSDAVTFWDASSIPSDRNEIDTVTVRVPKGQIENPVWVDLVTGNVYEIPEDCVSTDGDTLVFDEIPMYDGPGAIMDVNLVKYEPAKVVAKKKKK